MSIEILLEEIKQHEATIRTHQEKLAKKRQKAAEQLCPFKVGDRVINGEGKEEIIHAIRWAGNPCAYSKGYSFSIKKIKNNGEPYKDKSYAYSQEKYTKA